ncbi:MAG: hypothetical protein ACK4NH_11810, partial [Gemmobacter sp.]
AALAARNPAGILAGLSPGTLDLAARFALRQLQHRLARSAGWPPTDWFRRRRAPARADLIQIGPGCHIHPDAVLEAGPGALVLGPGCRVGAGARLVAGAGLSIGAETFIEAGAQIGGAGAQTGIGRACLITADSRIDAGTTMGAMCVTMPGRRVGGTHAAGAWLLPPGGDHIGSVAPTTVLS